MNRNIFIVLITILIVLVISPLLYYYYITKSASTTSIVQSDDLLLEGETTQKYPSTLFPHSNTGTKYTIAFSLYSNNYTESSIWGDKFNKPKGILTRFGAPSVFMIPKTNTLKVSVAYKNDLNIKESYNFEIPDFKYQRWEHIILTVDNRNISFFLNGKLIKGAKLPNVPWIPTKPMIIGQKNNNFNGKIKNVIYKNNSISFKEAMELYKNNI
jgi:hypothetical protein